MPDHPDQLTVFHRPEQGRFEINLGNAQALLEYRIEGDTIIFLHTEVPPAYEGRGIGSRLARAGLDFARAKDYHVVALCSFVEDFLRRHPEYRD